MRKILKVSLAVLVGLTASPCLAMGLGHESTGTINVTVIIPPLGEAVAAQEHGATGLWAILNGNDGLMINAPADVVGQSDLVVDLFTPYESQLQVRSFTGNFSAAGQTVNDITQLNQTRMALPLSDPTVWNYNPLNPRSKLYVIGTV